MSQPLLATHRVVLDYVPSGVRHTLRVYCNIGAPVAGVQKLLCRDGVTTIDFPVGAQKLWDLVAANMPTGTPAAQATLETLVGVVWNPVSIVTLTGTGSDSPFAPASQLTIVVRDTAFKKIRFVIMELCSGYVGHTATGLSMGTNIDPVTEDINGDDADPAGLYQWMKSRGNRYVLGTGSIAGATLDLNDKIKRRRNLE